MFNPIAPVKKIKNSAQLSLQVRREKKRNDKAMQSVLVEQEIRYSVIRELSALGLLKDGVC